MDDMATLAGVFTPAEQRLCESLLQFPDEVIPPDVLPRLCREHGCDSHKIKALLTTCGVILDLTPSMVSVHPGQPIGSIPAEIPVIYSMNRGQLVAMSRLFVKTAPTAENVVRLLDELLTRKLRNEERRLKVLLKPVSDPERKLELPSIEREQQRIWLDWQSLQSTWVAVRPKIVRELAGTGDDGPPPPTDSELRAWLIDAHWERGIKGDGFAVTRLPEADVERDRMDATEDAFCRWAEQYRLLVERLQRVGRLGIELGSMNRLQSLAVDFRADPVAFAPRFITRCQQLTDELLAMLTTGVVDEHSKRRWLDTTTEFRQHVALAEHEHAGIFNRWYERGFLSVDAIEALQEAAQFLGNCLGFPARVDHNKRPLVDALKRFIVASKFPADIGMPQPPAGTDPPVNDGETRTVGTNYADNPLAVLLTVYTNGVSDDRIKQAAALLSDSSLTVDQKLTKIDALMPFPPTASAEKLGIMLGVKKQAVAQSDWWKQKRKGEKQNEVGRRRTQHREKSKSLDDTPKDDEE